MELGKVEGFWSTLQLPQQALAKYFNIEQQAHWLLIRKETNQLHHVINDIIMSEWVRTYQPAPSRVSWQKCIFNMLFCVCAWAWACAPVCVLTYITQAYLCELNVSLFMCVGVYTHVNGEKVVINDCLLCVGSCYISVWEWGNHSWIFPLLLWQELIESWIFLPFFIMSLLILDTSRCPINSSS